MSLSCFLRFAGRDVPVFARCRRCRTAAHDARSVQHIVPNLNMSEDGEFITIPRFEINMTVAPLTLWYIGTAFRFSRFTKYIVFACFLRQPILSVGNPDELQPSNYAPPEVIRVHVVLVANVRGHPAQKQGPGVYLKVEMLRSRD